MKKYLFLFLVLPGIQTFAQLPEDAIRLSWQGHNGSARYMSIGGVMGSLGGDITAGHVNPAGLGFYRTREIVFSPGFLSTESAIDYRDASRVDLKKRSFTLGAMGFISGAVSRANPRKSQAFAITAVQVANLNSTLKYSALNNYSSYSEQFAEEFAKSGYSIDYVLNTNSSLPFTAAPALYTYLIDTVTVGSAIQVRGAAENILDAGEALRQEVSKINKGGIYELALSFAENNNDKWFYGVTLGVPLVGSSSLTTLVETDTSSRTDNNFKSATYVDDLSTSGAGLNLKFGAIYRPQDYIRLGFALHSPSYMVLTETRSTSVVNEGEGTFTTLSANSSQFTNGEAGKNTYIQSVPWKAIISGSYVFREEEDTRRQRGFISADIEYQHHKGGRFHAYEEKEGQSANYEAKKTYFKQVNNIIKDQYKGAFNFRVGGELKFNIIMARLGFAYYGTPHKDAPVKVSRTMLSGGLGYRHHGFFVDLTYVHNMSKNYDMPYRLEDRANTFATVKNTQGGIYATVGFKL